MNRQSLFENSYSGVKVLGMYREAWAVIVPIVTVIAILVIGLYYHEMEHIAFDTSAVTLSCIELEQLILGTHPTIDPHFVEESWERIGAIHNLRCK